MDASLCIIAYIEFIDSASFKQKTSIVSDVCK